MDCYCWSYQYEFTTYATKAIEKFANSPVSHILGCKIATRGREAIHTHEFFREYRGTKHHDLAVLVVDNPFLISDFVRPACLPPIGWLHVKMSENYFNILEVGKNVGK